MTSSNLPPRLRAAMMAQAARHAELGDLIENLTT